MKKKVITGILAATMVGATVFGLAACGKDKSGYGMVHQSYVGAVEVTRDGDTVKDVKIEEYFTPGQFTHTEEGKTLEGIELVDVATKDHGANVTQKHAKYIKIAGKVFEAVVSGDAAANAQTIAYKGEANGNKVDDILVWLKDSARTQEDYKWYVDACKKEKVKYMENSKKDSSTKVSYVGSNAKLQKTSSKYWGLNDSTISSGIGWAKNIEAIVAWVKENGVNWKDGLVEADFTRNGKVPSLSGSAITGATLGTDLNQYLNVIKKAYVAAA
jgi:hypothetical protein